MSSNTISLNNFSHQWLESQFVFIQKYIVLTYPVPSFSFPWSCFLQGTWVVVFSLLCQIVLFQ